MTATRYATPSHGARRRSCSPSRSPSAWPPAPRAARRPRPAGGSPVSGGTAYFAEQPLAPPTYIFPLVSGEYFTIANTSDLQTLLYLPLYWYGDEGKASIDYPLSIGNPPVYSDGDRVVTITLKHYVWSDGEIVSARDVGFWINLLKANKAGLGVLRSRRVPRQRRLLDGRSAPPPSGSASTPATTRSGSPTTSYPRSLRCRSPGTGPRWPPSRPVAGRGEPAGHHRPRARRPCTAS